MLAWPDKSLANFASTLGLLRTRAGQGGGSIYYKESARALMKLRSFMADSQHTGDPRSVIPGQVRRPENSRELMMPLWPQELARKASASEWKRNDVSTQVSDGRGFLWEKASTFWSVKAYWLDEACLPKSKYSLLSLPIQMPNSSLNEMSFRDILNDIWLKI